MEVETLLVSVDPASVRVVEVEAWACEHCSWPVRVPQWPTPPGYCRECGLARSPARRTVTALAWDATSAHWREVSWRRSPLAKLCAIDAAPLSAVRFVSTFGPLPYGPSGYWEASKEVGAPHPIAWYQLDARLANMARSLVPAVRTGASAPKTGWESLLSRVFEVADSSLRVRSARRALVGYVESLLQSEPLTAAPQLSAKWRTDLAPLARLRLTARSSLGLIGYELLHQLLQPPSGGVLCKQEGCDRFVVQEERPGRPREYCDAHGSRAARDRRYNRRRRHAT